MDAAYFRTLFAYNQWARERILEQVGKLSFEDYTAPRVLDYGSIRATLVHNLAAEAGYIARLQGLPRDSSIDEANLPTLDALRSRWNAEQGKLDSFLAALTDADVSRETRVASTRPGGDFVHPLWAFLTQSINHSTQHRSEIALTITQLGLSPGDLDFMLYLRQPAAVDSRA
ncbi:MAG: hypothetical protein QOF51_1705 [Chloroflexota bacterium]|jgi:uncharacterized damage-inducible protein DinB|nr:hypothetical protein [Chloroflexota bacterium]